jgi:biopolymer transport protein TolQ
MLDRIVLAQVGLWDLLSHATTFSWIILITLVSMSLGTWGVIVNKWRTFKAAEADGRRFFSTFHRRTNLKEAHDKCLTYKATPLAKVFEEGYRELQALTSIKRNNGGGAISSPESAVIAPAKLLPEEVEAIDKILEKEASMQISTLERNVAFLATCANVAPFIGLLGTCWGIMNSFMNIGAQGSASLIVVAPGIAEALVATIVGLAVAIPSVVAFNWCNTKLKFIADDLNNFSLEFLAAVTREQAS